MQSYQLNIIENSFYFDETWYMHEYQDVAALGLSPAAHYLMFGARMLRDPSPRFSTARYYSDHPDVLAAGLNPLCHYEVDGKPEGRVIHPSARSSRRYRTSDHGFPGRRVAVFATYSGSQTVDDYVMIYLRKLREACDEIVVVSDNDYCSDEVGKLLAITSHVVIGRHAEYDFGSYKRGIRYLREASLLDDADELVLCNDSCYGPIGDLQAVFTEMERRGSDFWGLTNNTAFASHIQSYFVTFKRSVFEHPKFAEFFNRVRSHDTVQEVILTYEVPMTSYIQDLGFRWDTLINNSTPGYGAILHQNPNVTVQPLFLIDSGCPFVKVKALKRIDCNYQGIIPLLDRLRSEDPEMYAAIVAHARPDKFLASADIRFSVIMPYYNRASSIFTAIDSALAQKHQSFELVVVDDGSTDGADEAIRRRYAPEIAQGKLVLLACGRRKGVCAARNLGLKAAKHPWIAYLDSDNVMKPDHLETFAEAIIDRPEQSAFYSCFEPMSTGTPAGAPFSRKELEKGNFIDLGVFVHARALVDEKGGFDESLKRLVDWELILRYTEGRDAFFLRRSLMRYSDRTSDTSRISVAESMDDARTAIRLKHKLQFAVTTIVPTYNHRKYAREALESVIGQEGDFRHQILVSDDGSTDGTDEIVRKFAASHRDRVQNLSARENKGISANFQRCIEAATGDFIAILEGDDVWTSAEKLQKQYRFLLDNPDCSMVFSKVIVSSEETGAHRLLSRQMSLKSNKLTGADFLAHESMNLIANLSSCMFKAGLLRTLPPRLFEGRINEIALAFHFERHGKIGFIPEPMSIYRQHAAGTWTGRSREAQLASGLAVREMTMAVADPKYHQAINCVIEEKYRKPVTSAA